MINHEHTYEKQEGIMSFILQLLVYITVFFLFTVTCDIDKMVGEYLSPLYPEGFEFRLNGYSERDIADLENMGFYNISFSSVGKQGYGTTNDLANIWLYKLRAAFSGNDIWNEEIDEILGVILLGQVVFGTIGIAMLLIMMNNLSNSIAMKLMSRRHYVQMLKQLGCTKQISQSIFLGLFCARTLLAFFLAMVINAQFIKQTNYYVKRYMYIPSSFVEYNWMLIFGVGIISIMLLWFSFQMQWRKMDGY